ncbi:serpin family protein [Hoyosella subflava]|uniref:Serine (Or cysteine) proteinase inhibitor, clade B (Ovalbumin), member n=1 Tax=Hoyosella subflava (strain DSM 45089 / JCM 17490 / NBRC 109087 / DQS3-9A1) TaxID=443218 RepID=F6EGA4_HOYSD|nr:serpin family protein [Hoyosella subflava]AEF39829.1 Serine (Or cysteine) proteinase inhibitor, clade B (Ovalbumin), member [Hoyosella subflava DQS3-9A1]
MRIRKAAALGVGAVFMLATACGTTEPSDSEPEATTTAAPAASEPVDEFIAGLYEFSESFARSIAQDDEGRENTVYSPVSIAYAFAMLRAGAEGETAAQLDAVFGFPAEGLNEAVRALADEAVTVDDVPPRTEPGETRGPDDEPAEPIVALANGLFVQEGLTVESDFTTTLSEYFDAEAQNVDFTSPEAVETIDTWVEENTAGRIDQLFDELDPETIAVLANAIYMKAEWENQFSESATEDDDFTKADGSVVTVPMMNKQSATVRYATGEDWQAIELPYSGGELSMWVLISETDDLAAPPLTASTLEALADGGTSVSADIVLPRWDFGSTVQLLEQLRGLGLTNLSELDGITSDFMVSDAVHRATITVNEQGTEAAAVTGVAGVTSLPPEAQVEFRADKPYTFAIMHTPTGAPLFLGSVEDPSQ